MANVTLVDFKILFDLWIYEENIYRAVVTVAVGGLALLDAGSSVGTVMIRMTFHGRSALHWLQILSSL